MTILNEIYTILRLIIDCFEFHHGITITDNAFVAAAQLSNRYITDRYLPDKAIDLVDEACATIRVQMDSVPNALDSLTRKIMRLEIERQAIRREKDQLSLKRKDEIEKELGELKKKEKDYKEAWEEEKSINDKINAKKKEIEKARFELEQALNKYDLENSAKLQHGTIPKLEKELEELKSHDN